LKRAQLIGHIFCGIRRGARQSQPYFVEQRLRGFFLARARGHDQANQQHGISDHRVGILKIEWR